MAQPPTWDGSWDPSPPHSPRVLGYRDPLSWHRTVGEEGNRGCPGGAGRVRVGMGLGAKSKPCKGPAEQQGQTLPGCSSVEGDAGADAQ